MNTEFSRYVAPTQVQSLDSNIGQSDAKVVNSLSSETLTKSHVLSKAMVVTFIKIFHMHL